MVRVRILWYIVVTKLNIPGADVAELLRHGWSWAYNLLMSVPFPPTLCPKRGGCFYPVVQRI